MLKRCIASGGAVLMAMAFSVNSLAQGKEFPSRPLRIFVPFSAGSGSDTPARLFGESMQKFQQDDLARFPRMAKMAGIQPE